MPVVTLHYSDSRWLVEPFLWCPQDHSIFHISNTLHTLDSKTARNTHWNPDAPNIIKTKFYCLPWKTQIRNIVPISRICSREQSSGQTHPGFGCLEVLAACRRRSVTPQQSSSDKKSQIAGNNRLILIDQVSTKL